LENLAVQKISEKFPQHVLGLEDMSGSPAVLVSAAGLVEVVTFLRDDPALGFNFLMDLAAADYLKFPVEKPGRFCVAYQFYSLSKNLRVCLKLYLPGEDPVAPTLSGLYAGANWLEREAWDMYGIRFEGHPDLRRILLYPEFEGHALRKDYPIGKMQPLIPMREAIDYEQVRVEMRKQAEGK
jgi:NADH-quinone oxidoreductase subunit C